MVTRPHPFSSGLIAEEAPRARAKGLIIVRESDLHDEHAFDCMRQQTYLSIPDKDPAVAAIEAVGMKPWHAKNGYLTVEEKTPLGSVQHQVRVDVLRRGRTKILRFSYGGYDHLWGMTSAAKSGSDGSNDFTFLSCEVIRERRPITLYAANISRIIRAQEHANTLIAAMRGNVDGLWIGTGVVIPLTGEQTEFGYMLLNVLGLVASLERSWIVQRTETGRVWRALRGYPLGANSVPFGYRLTKDKQLVPNLRLRRKVARMLAILATDAPPSEKARQLGQIGVLTTGVVKRLKRRATVDMLSDPSKLIDQMYGWASLYIGGEYLFRLTNNIPYVDHVADVEVMRHPTDPNDMGELQILVKASNPVEGWAPQAVLDALTLKVIERNLEVISASGCDPRPLSSRIMKEVTCDPRLHSTRLPRAARSGGIGKMPLPWRLRIAAAHSKSIIAALAGRTWEDENGYENMLISEGDSMLRWVRWEQGRQRGPIQSSSAPPPPLVQVGGAE